MASLEYSHIIFLFISLISFIFFIIKLVKGRSNHELPSDWPVLGMVPGVLVNAHRIHDYATDLVTSSGGTFMFKGPRFAKMDMLVTAHPSDINYVLSKNFSNYQKGPKLRMIFDMLGDGIITSDGELWQLHRKTTRSLFKHSDFQTLLETIISDNLEKGLLPIFESRSKQGTKMDLQEVFQRFTFDIICKLMLDYDTESLRPDFRHFPLADAILDWEEVTLRRHVLPQSVWKLQQLLGIGKEKTMGDAPKIVDQFIDECLAQNMKKNISHGGEEHEEKFKLLSSFMREFKDQGGTTGDPNKFLKDTLLTLVVAGSGTSSAALSWFFYLIAKNPSVQDKIRQEIHAQLEVKIFDHKWKHFNEKDTRKLVYLHGALLESLRLFPPVPFNHKSPLQPDVLPSGHHVEKNTNIILSFYAMGRMTSIWGEDCMEFKPERWISGGGMIKHEPTYKFAVFSAGPRTCVAKEMSSSLLKIVAATIICNYHIELVEGHLVIPSDSMMLHMKHGMKVRLTKISEVNF